MIHFILLFTAYLHEVTGYDKISRISDSYGSHHYQGTYQGGRVFSGAESTLHPPPCTPSYNVCNTCVDFMNYFSSMLPILQARHHISRLRAGVFRIPSTSASFASISNMVGQRLFPQYSVEPVSRDLIPSKSRSKPQVLWLGCSDSGYEETTILDLIPEEMIVVRNCGNMALTDDLAWSSAVYHAVENLQGISFFIFLFPDLEPDKHVEPIGFQSNYIYSESHHRLWPSWMWACEARPDCSYFRISLAKVSKSQISQAPLQLYICVEFATDLFFPAKKTKQPANTTPTPTGIPGRKGSQPVYCGSQCHRTNAPCERSARIYQP